MKKSILYCLLIITVNLHAQVGIGTTNPDESAVLDISSTEKGMLIPRLSTAQRTAIASPATGLLVYDATTNGFWFYNGSQWTDLSASTGSGWLLQGNSGTDPLSDFIGTTDDADLNFRVESLRVGHLGTNASKNIFWGIDTGLANTSGNENIGIGYQSFPANTSGDRNIALGSYSLYQNDIGSGNIAMGEGAMYSNLTGNNNLAIGFNALFNNSSGFTNTAFGSSALRSNTTGNYNIAIGPSTLTSNTIGLRNTAMGFNALYSNTTGNFNLALGDRARSEELTSELQ